MSLRVSCANVPEGQSIKTDKVNGQKTSAFQLIVYSGQLVSQPIRKLKSVFLFLLKF